MKYLVCIFCTLLLSVTSLFAKPSDTPILVAVSIPPQKYFVEQIAGNKASVTVIVPKGFEPEDYEPRPQQLKALTHAVLYFAIDVPFETQWLKKFQQVSPHMKIIPTYQGIEKIEMSPHGHHHHHHAHQIIKDPHIWLSPQLVQIQAQHIRDAFIQVDPKHAAFYRHNYQKFSDQIEALNQSLIKLFAKAPNPKERIFFIFHPALGYFAKAYDLTQIPIEKEGKSPTLKQLNTLAKFAKHNQIKTIFISPEFSSREASVFAKAIGGRTQIIDPLAESWLDNMKRLASAIFNSFPHQ